MANVNILFNCNSRDGNTIETEMSPHTLGRPDEILISIDNGIEYMSVYLDKSTAIKFAKTLRTEINKIDSEVSNG